MPEPAEISFRSMELQDIGDVMRIERESFPTPWSEEIFRQDLLDNQNSCYIVGAVDDEIVSYAGIWIMNEIGHITTMAVRLDSRRRGFGDATLVELMRLGTSGGVEKFTLEVRVGNDPAIILYEKYGFKQIGIRKNYYREINADALVMWTGDPPYEN